MSNPEDGAEVLSRLRPPGWQAGTSPSTEARERAILYARRLIAEAADVGGEMMNLARQYLRCLGLSP